MSYDLHLFRPVAGVELLETARASLETESEELNVGPPVPEKEQQKRQNAALLQIVNPDLEIYPFDYAGIARTSGCSEAEARVRYRHLELNGVEDGNGIQITLWDDTVSITVPYWHGGERAEPVLTEIWDLDGGLAGCRRPVLCGGRSIAGDYGEKAGKGCTTGSAALVEVLVKRDV